MWCKSLCFLLRQRRNAFLSLFLTMKTRNKVSIAIPFVLLVVMLTASVAAEAMPPPVSNTATPIEHLVVIFQENVSFDHYFATYPSAANTDGTPFTARPDTPSVNGLNDPLSSPSNPS